MSNLVYGALSTTDDFTHTLSYKKQAVLNGPDYLWTKFTFHVKTILNVAAAGSGLSPMATDIAVRHRLAQPRQKLKFTVGGVVLLECPAAGATVDANNGPTSEVIDVRAIRGINSFEVELVIVCCVIESPTPTVLLSHRWTQRQTWDEDYYTTILTTGTAVFRTDRLALLNATPDDYRAWLFLPIPPNFKREADVEVDEENYTLQYRLVDREQAVNVLLGNVTRIECLHERSVGYMGAEQQTINTGGALTEMFSLNPMDWAKGLGKGIKEAARGDVPIVRINIGVRVFGNRKSTNQSLQDAAMAFLLSRISDINVQLATREFSVTRDEMGRFVEVRALLTCGPTQGLLQQIQAGGAGGVPGFKFPNTDPTGVTAGDSKGALPPGTSNAWGTYLGKVAAAVFLPMDATPAKPQLPGPANPKTPP